MDLLTNTEAETTKPRVRGSEQAETAIVVVSIIILVVIVLSVIYVCYINFARKPAVTLESSEREQILEKREEVASPSNNTEAV